MTEQEIYDSVADTYAHYLATAQWFLQVKVHEDYNGNITPEQLVQAMQHMYTVGFLSSNVMHDFPNSKQAVPIMQMYFGMCSDQLKSFLPIDFIARNKQ